MIILKPLTLTFLLLILSCSKDTSKTSSNALNNSSDTDNYFIIDGRTVFRVNKINGQNNVVLCNSPQYSWMNDFSAPTTKEFLGITNAEEGSILIHYTANNDTKKYTYKLKTPLPVKIVGGNTCIEFNSLEFYEWGSTTVSKIISGKITCK